MWSEIGFYKAAAHVYAKRVWCDFGGMLERPNEWMWRTSNKQHCNGPLTVSLSGFDQMQRVNKRRARYGK
jgi:hypothetical protein